MFPPGLRQRVITVPAAPVVRRMRVAGSGVAASGAGGFGSRTGPRSGAGGLLAGGAGPSPVPSAIAVPLPNIPDNTGDAFAGSSVR